MVWVLIFLLSIIGVILVKDGGTASIEMPKNVVNISNSTSPYSFMNMTEDEYSAGILILESNQTDTNNYGEGVIVNVINDHDANLDLSSFIPSSPPTNITCTRRNYDEDVTAIFKEQVGPINTAYLVFNTTYGSYYTGRILNTTELIGLNMINETVVDCDEYSIIKTRRLNRFTQSSLVG